MHIDYYTPNHWPKLMDRLATLTDRAPALKVQSARLRDALLADGLPPEHCPPLSEFATVVASITGAERYTRGGANWFRGLGLSCKTVTP